ncbi:hypothetical protein Mapa_017622 [Marchantia paleacea]|nr:hypothetical protein Mapa_017618 [Marchantia paleacea]KAG6541045.1 hypothetical protein Mapa_017622 [Marchantia paleacea]
MDVTDVWTGGERGAWGSAVRWLVGAGFRAFAWVGARGISSSGFATMAPSPPPPLRPKPFSRRGDGRRT